MSFTGRCSGGCSFFSSCSADVEVGAGGSTGNVLSLLLMAAVQQVMVYLFESFAIVGQWVVIDSDRSCCWSILVPLCICV